VAGQDAADIVRLVEHPDFDQAVIGAGEYYAERRLRPALIEKDYYVTEALRIIAHIHGDKVIFKGGTSLAKGWNLIQGFSEGGRRPVGVLPRRQHVEPASRAAGEAE
jgi:hypothetical protein